MKFNWKTIAFIFGGFLFGSAKASNLPSQKMDSKISAIRKKFADDLQSAQDQISAVREKYRTDRYALMDRVSPGSGTSMAKRDKGIADLDAQFRKDMDALNAKQGAEAAAGTMTKESQAKFQADRKALMDAYAAKKQELFSLPSATTGK